MPIYAYRCTSCGHAKDVLQKISDPLLSDCPACGAATFVKQVTAAGFQLKGSGWYVTDFRGGNTGAKAEGEGKEPAEKNAEKNDGKGDGKVGDKTADSSGSKGGGESSGALAAAAPATTTSAKAAAPAAPAAAPSAPAPSPSGG